MRLERFYMGVAAPIQYKIVQVFSASRNVRAFLNLAERSYLRLLQITYVTFQPLLVIFHLLM